MSAKTIGGQFGWRLQKAVIVEELTRELLALLPVQAVSTSPFQAEIDHSNLVRDHLVGLYQHAVDGTIDDFSRQFHLAFRKHKPDNEGGIVALFLILSDDFEAEFAREMKAVGTKAYLYAEPAMGDASWGVLKDRAEEFGKLRAKDLTNAPKEVLERAQGSILRGLAGKETPGALQRRLDEALREAKDVEGRRVAETEATITLGTAVDHVMSAVGFTHKRWLSQRDDRVRHSHEECDKQGWIPIGKTFVNGLKYPGQADAPPGEIIGCRCILVGEKRRNIQASEFEESKHPRLGKGMEHGGEFTSKSGGIALSRKGIGKEARWTTIEGLDIPEYVKKLGIPPAWTNVKVAALPTSKLQAIGKDAKGREQRIYSEEFSREMARLKFERNKELLEKVKSIHQQNESNLRSLDETTRESAACLKLILATGIRPGSETDTGAEKQAYGATTLQGRHVVFEDGELYLRFIGKKGVALNIPVKDLEVRAMLTTRKAKSGESGKLFQTDNRLLRGYVHSLDGGSFKPKDFRTLKGTMTAIAEIDKDPVPAKTMKDYKKKVMTIAKVVSLVLGNTPTIALQSYINPFVFQRIQPVGGLT